MTPPPTRKRKRSTNSTTTTRASSRGGSGVGRRGGRRRRAARPRRSRRGIPGGRRTRRSRVRVRFEDRSKTEPGRPRPTSARARRAPSTPTTATRSEPRSSRAKNAETPSFLRRVVTMGQTTPSHRGYRWPHPPGSSTGGVCGSFGLGTRSGTRYSTWRARWVGGGAPSFCFAAARTSTRKTRTASPPSIARWRTASSTSRTIS